MVERVMAEERAYAAVCRQRLVLQFVVVDELCLVDEEPGERERVAGAGRSCEMMMAQEPL